MHGNVIFRMKYIMIDGQYTAANISGTILYRFNPVSLQ